MSNNPFPLEDGDPGTPFYGAHADRDGSESKEKELHSYLAADAGSEEVVWGDVRHHRERIEQLKNWCQQWWARADRAEAEVMRYQTGSAYEVGYDHGSATAGPFKDRAERAEATLDRVQALADDDSRHMVRWLDGSHLIDVSDLRAVLDAPQPEDAETFDRNLAVGQSVTLVFGRNAEPAPEAGGDDE